MTLGIYAPSIHINTDLDKSNDVAQSNSNATENIQTIVDRVDKPSDTSLTASLSGETEQVDKINVLTEKAREQAISKLGPKIIKEVDHEFNETILPNIERRSEERRVGKECRTRRWTDNEKTKKEMKTRRKDVT